MVVRASPTSPWRCIGNSTSDHEGDGETTLDVGEGEVATGNAVGLKRKLQPDGQDAREQKRPRIPSDSATSSVAPCLAPTPSPIAAQIFQQQHDDGGSHGSGDLFLTDGFRERWCRCEDASPSSSLQRIIQLTRRGHLVSGFVGNSSVPRRRGRDTRAARRPRFRYALVLELRG